MNILYAAADLRDADCIRHEMSRMAPHLRLDCTGTLRDARERLLNPGGYEAALIDLRLPDGDGLSLVSHIRDRQVPLAVIVIVGARDEDPPVAALGAGADAYVVKGKEFLTRLPVVLEQALERRGQSERVSQLRVLYAGDIDRLRLQLAHEAPHLQLTSATDGPKGVFRLPPAAAAAPPFDVVLVDETAPAVNAADVVKDLKTRAIDLPVVLLVPPAEEDAAIQALQLGVADYIVKTPGYAGRLPPRLHHAIARHRLIREHAALRATDARLRSIIETQPSCLMRVTTDGTVLAMNAAGLGLLGATALDQIVGTSFYAVVVPEDLDRCRDFIGRVCGGERGSLQFDVVGFCGTRRALETHACPLLEEGGGVTSAIGVMRDLTERRRLENSLHDTAAVQKLADQDVARIEELEQALRESNEQRQELTIARSELEQALRDAETRHEQSAAHHLGEREVLEKALREAEPSRQQLVAQHLAERTALEQALRDSQLRHEEIAARHGSVRDELARALRDAEARREELVAESRAEREAAQQTFRDAEARREQLIVQHRAEREALEQRIRDVEAHQAPLAAQQGEARDEVARTRQEAEYRCEQLAAQHHAERAAFEQALYEAQARHQALAAQHHQARDEVARALQEADRRYEQLAAQHRAERTRLTQALDESETRYRALAARQETDEGRAEGASPEGQGRPIENGAARRALEDRLRHAERMEAVGRLATGVAGDLNGLVTAMLDQVNVLLDRSGPDDLRRAPAQNVKATVGRAGALARQILAFSRKQSRSPDMQELGTVVRHLDERVRWLLGDEIELDTTSVTRAGHVVVDREHVERILMNLAVYGRDVLPAGGRFTIETLDADTDPDSANGAGRRPHAYVRLTVAATGWGLDAEVQARLAQALSTAPDPTDGTETWLTSLQRIVRQSGGRIQIHNDFGHAMTVSIDLPRGEAPIERPDAERRSA